MDNLARAAKQNLLEFFTYLGRSPAADFARDGDLTRWRTGVPHPWFNGVRLPRPPVPGDATRLAALTACFVRESYTVWIDYDAEPAAWRPLLQGHGLLYDGGAPGMALDLAALPPHLEQPPGFRIEAVRDAEGLRLWCGTFVRGYEVPRHWLEPLHSLLLGLGLTQPVSHALGLMDGVPVATSSLFEGAGVAGVQFVSTVPEARRQRLGGLITLHPLYASRARGLKQAVLQSSEAGFGLYQRIGFQHVSHVDNWYKP